LTIIFSVKTDAAMHRTNSKSVSTFAGGWRFELELADLTAAFAELELGVN
jgi:hypothetical protein